jgi:hypothetical protein
MASAAATAFGIGSRSAGFSPSANNPGGVIMVAGMGGGTFEVMEFITDELAKFQITAIEG